MKQYTVSEKFLNDAISESAKALVGIVMKRFEILDNKDDIKKAIKELIYENHRNLKGLIKSFSCGVVFKTKPREE